MKNVKETQKIGIAFIKLGLSLMVLLLMLVPVVALLIGLLFG